MDICKNDKNGKRFKSNDGTVGKLFSSLHTLLRTCRHDNTKGISILNYKQFIINLNNHLKDDLPNAVNYIRVSLDSIKKDITYHINDFLNDQNSQFFYKQWYLTALDIIEIKLFMETKQI